MKKDLTVAVKEDDIVRRAGESDTSRGLTEELRVCYTHNDEEFHTNGR